LLAAQPQAVDDVMHHDGNFVPLNVGSRLLKNSIWFLVLGGAAVYRCDKCPIFSAGFSR
jgi:hypothetical protein